MCDVCALHFDVRVHRIDRITNKWKSWKSGNSKTSKRNVKKYYKNKNSIESSRTTYSVVPIRCNVAHTLHTGMAAYSPEIVLCTHSIAFSFEKCRRRRRRSNKIGRHTIVLLFVFVRFIFFRLFFFVFFCFFSSRILFVNVQLLHVKDYGLPVVVVVCLPVAALHRCCCRHSAIVVIVVIGVAVVVVVVAISVYECRWMQWKLFRIITRIPNEEKPWLQPARNSHDWNEAISIISVCIDIA